MSNHPVDLVQDSIRFQLESMDTQLKRLHEVSTQIRTNQLGGGREVALAITNLEQAMFWLNASISKVVMIG